MLDTNSTIRGFGDEPGLVTICIVILLVGIIIQLKYFKYSRTQPCNKAWDKTNEKNRVQYHIVFTIMIVLGKILDEKSILFFQNSLNSKIQFQQS